MTARIYTAAYVHKTWNELRPRMITRRSVHPLLAETFTDPPNVRENGYVQFENDEDYNAHFKTFIFNDKLIDLLRQMGTFMSRRMSNCMCTKLNTTQIFPFRSLNHA